MDHIVSRVPLHLDIELNTGCNLKCEFCPNHSPKARYPPPKNKKMDWELYKQVIDEAVEKGVCAVKLSFRGEPLLYKNISLAIMYAKKKGIMEVMLNTNGLLLNEAMGMDILLSNLDKLIISDYGLPKQTYNIKKFQEIKKRFKIKKPNVIVHSTDHLKWYGLADEFGEMRIHDYNSGMECLERKEFKCEQLWQRLTVLYDGSVKMCCSSVLLPDSIIGSVKENTLEELWTSDYMKYIRWCHMEHAVDLITSCRYCPGFIEAK